jgi:hypothetical protein
MARFKVVAICGKNVGMKRRFRRWEHWEVEEARFVEVHLDML